MQAVAVISVEGLYKHYGPVKAVDGVSFQINAGEIFGMVGPNGSGKTTTIECIEGLRQPDQGKLRVLGLDPQQDFYALRERIGVQLQASNLPARLRLEEALELFASFYRQTADWRPLIQELGLADKRRAFYSQLSGGQKQRLFIALALLNQPEIVFLDELTTGLDPQARRLTWELVRQIRERGTTVFLTTHFMDEAERLCDQVAILDHGQVLALDTPSNLVSQLGMSRRVAFQISDDGLVYTKSTAQGSSEPAFDPGILKTIVGVQKVDWDGEAVTVYGQGNELAGQVVMALGNAGVGFTDLLSERANLEYVFLALTGRAIRN